MMNDTLPSLEYTQAYCNYENALREFEAAHEVWMNTSVFTPEGVRAKALKDSAAAKYIAARNIWEASKN